MDKLVRQVAKRHLGRLKTAGEVRFVKDRSGDHNEWGWGAPGPSERTIQEDFEFNPKHLKPLARVLRAGLLSMGHALSAHADFARIKSADLSPDGALGGKGYIQKIPEMRRQLMNVVEALSAFTDTLYDEIKAPHWNPALKDQSPREREEVKDIMTDVEEIRSNPEEFAEKEEAEMDEDTQKQTSKTASTKTTGLLIEKFNGDLRGVLHKETMTLRAEITKLLQGLSRASGAPIKDMRGAVDSLMEMLLDDGVLTWEEWQSDRFWGDSFLYFDHLVTERVADRYVRGE